MERNENLRHWESWAGQFGESLRATTKCLTIKRLEIAALGRAIRRFAATEKAPVVLEIGSGNGVNAFLLLEELVETFCYLGVDFSPTMIANATQIALTQLKHNKRVANLAFATADARTLSLPIANPDGYVGADVGLNQISSADIVFTDRMLINLASAKEQLEVMQRIKSILRPGGLFLMLENSAQTHARLNATRQALGLPARPVADYNVFIDESVVIEQFRREMALLYVDDFSAVHDLLLYAVAPAAAPAASVEYDTPLMERLTDALISLERGGMSTSLGCGQNRLWVWKRND